MSENSLLIKLQKTAMDYTVARQQIINATFSEINQFVEKYLMSQANMGLYVAIVSIDDLFCRSEAVRSYCISAVTEDNINLTQLGEKLFSSFKKNNVHRIGTSPCDLHNYNSILTRDEHKFVTIKIMEYLRGRGLLCEQIDRSIMVKWS